MKWSITFCKEPRVGAWAVNIEVNRFLIGVVINWRTPTHVISGSERWRMRTFP
jgi:hypothetical protein